MKTKLLFICTLLFAVGQSFAQIYVFEPFDYALTGTQPAPQQTLLDNGRTNPVTMTDWINRQSAVGDMEVVDNHPGWQIDQAFDLNPQFNSVHFQGGGEDGALPFAAPINISNSGPGNSVYLSFFIDIIGWDATATNNPDQYRLVHFGVDNNNGGWNAGSGLYVGPGTDSPATTFRLGYNNSDKNNDVVWSPTNYDFTDLGNPDSPVVANQFFIVVKFTFGLNGDGQAGGTDGYMWINPVITGAEPAADLTQDSSLAERQRTEFGAINIECGSNDRTPDAFVDEIRVTGTWEEATGRPALSVSDNVLASKFKVYPNPANDVITVASKNINVTSVSLYSVLGKQVLSGLQLKNNRLDIAALSKGVYFMKINSDQGTVTKRIIKQ